jgi:hypothetical protein
MAHSDETPASKVVRLFGGYKAVAELVGTSELQVRRWNYPKSKKGAAGQVPSKHHSTLVSAAKARGIRLSPKDLMPWLAGRAA